MSYDARRGGAEQVEGGTSGAVTESPGKRTPTSGIVQRKAEEPGRQDAAASTMQEMSSGFGMSFSGVQVHADAAGDARAQAHGSLAVTEGSDIFVSNAVTPDSAGGRQVLAHEMAHVAQQSEAAPGNGAIGPRGDAFEAEADTVGAIVAGGGSATPQLRTPATVAQGYGGAEHQHMADSVHGTLDQVLADAEDPEYGVCREGDDEHSYGESRIPTFGGFSEAERDQQRYNELSGANHAPGAGSVDSVESRAVAVPHLATMLANDPFQDRARSLTVPLRNFKMASDAAGPYLAIDVDPSTKEAIRYDVPCSPGDLTSLMGDLYGTMENLRKAPATEFVAVQGVVDAEARWEHAVAAGTADLDNEPNFDNEWEAATVWRSQPVYGNGKEVGIQGDVAGGDTQSYMGLALTNDSHYATGTAEKEAIEVKVETGGLETVAAGPQGNNANGNEQAWLSGHARALLLAKESYTLRTANPAAVPSPDVIRAQTNSYGHEANVPETGQLDPSKGSKPPTPKGQDGQPLQRSSGVPTPESKLNDAYVDNAGADHYLTDSYAAGHQIVRDVIGQVTDKFVADAGGRDKFLSYVVEQIQYGAYWDLPTEEEKKKEKLAPELEKFRDLSHTWKDKAARGDSWLNSEWNILRHVGVGGDGLKQKLDKEIDAAKLHGLGTKLVHDYYNRHGLIVSNRKGMTFMTRGDGAADQAPEAQRIIALSILESRNQITECAQTGATPNPLDVWAYTPDFDKTLFTETSGRKVLELMFADGDYLWRLIKNNFSVGSGTPKPRAPDPNPVEEQIRDTPDPGNAGGPDGAGAGRGGGAPADVGTKPAQAWLRRRREYLRQHGQPTYVESAPIGAGAGSRSR